MGMGLRRPRWPKWVSVLPRNAMQEVVEKVLVDLDVDVNTMAVLAAGD